MGSDTAPAHTADTASAHAAAADHPRRGRSGDRGSRRSWPGSGRRSWARPLRAPHSWRREAAAQRPPSSTGRVQGPGRRRPPERASSPQTRGPSRRSWIRASLAITSAGTRTRPWPASQPRSLRTPSRVSCARRRRRSSRGSRTTCSCIRARRCCDGRSATSSRFGRRPGTGSGRSRRVPRDRGGCSRVAP